MALWDATSISEPLNEAMAVPLGYSNDLGKMDLLAINIDLSNIEEVSTDADVEIKQAMH